MFTTYIFYAVMFFYNENDSLCNKILQRSNFYWIIYHVFWEKYFGKSETPSIYDNTLNQKIDENIARFI